MMGEPYLNDVPPLKKIPRAEGRITITNAAVRKMFLNLTKWGLFFSSIAAKVLRRLTGVVQHKWAFSVSLPNGEGSFFVWRIKKWREHSARSCLCIRHRICRVGRCPDGKGWLRRFHGGRACIPSFTFSQPISTFIAFAYRRDLDNPPRSLYIGNRRKPNLAAFRWGPHRKCGLRHSWAP